jgi:hypothetical protein
MVALGDRSGVVVDKTRSSLESALASITRGVEGGV